jgi:hypothetical protein
VPAWLDAQVVCGASRVLRVSFALLSLSVSTKVATEIPARFRSGGNGRARIAETEQKPAFETITNTGDGISFSNNQSGVTLAGINIQNVQVSGFGHVGIHLVARNGSRFSGISISYCSTHHNGYGGLGVDAQGAYASNLYIGHVQAYHNAGANRTDSGYGIHLIDVGDVIVERSVADDNGWLPGNGGETGGIAANQCNRAPLQYNESYANHAGKSDGDGVILDATTNSIMQYNYTHDNDGGGLFLGAELGHFSNNNVVRYNISQNDARTQGSTYGGIFV